MQRRFKNNSNIITKSGKSIEVVNFIGSGGQGEVYEILIDSRRLALKWYYIHTGTQKQKELIESLIKTKKPDERFLWPIELIEIKNKKSFGYFMSLRPNQFSNIVDLMKRRIEPSFNTVITACIQLADSFLKLHNNDLCYRDISFGNFFFHSKTGDILICDNDNVTDINSSYSGVLGTPRFMAPEVVNGISKPNIQTDLFSLSVLIFYMLMMHHPLEGMKESKIKCFDLPAMVKLYGKEPIFIFDPINNSNRPILGIHDNAIAFWPIYTEKIRKIFIKTFSEGSKNPKNRIPEKIWRDVLIDLKNSIVICDCGVENFYDVENVKLDKKNKCWNCNKELSLPARIKIADEVIVLNLSTKLYGHHLFLDQKYKFKRILAEVVVHPKIRGLTGLKNLSKTPWYVITENKQKYVVEFGKSFTVENGTKVNFGEVEGLIRKG